MALQQARSTSDELETRMDWRQSSSWRRPSIKGSDEEDGEGAVRAVDDGAVARGEVRM